MHQTDIKRISRDEIRRGEVVERVVNHAGVAYTAILKNGYEVATAPTDKEQELFEWWEQEGRKMWEDGRKRKNGKELTDKIGTRTRTSGRGYT